MFQMVNNKTMLKDLPYRVGKKLVQIWIPAASSLYFGLSGIWGLPATTQVVGTSALVCTFLGVVLGISAKNYDASDAAYDGHMVVNEGEDGKKVVSLELNQPPVDIDQKQSISFKVKQP